MPGNTDPIFSRVADVSNNAGTGMNQPITSAANDFTGAGANNSLVFTADATNGGFIQRLRFKAAGTNVASVARIFINNGSTHTTAANNTFYGEIGLPATTSSATGVTGSDIDYPLNIALNAGFTIYVGLGTTVAAGWVITPVAGKY
jgi:hypothetical protein